MRRALVVILCASGLFAQRRLKVFISADMEGVAGVVSPGQLTPGSFEYERFRVFMTQEVLAAIEGVREAGAAEFVVADSHGNEQNLLIEKFPADVRIVRGEPRQLGMMAGIDSTFDAAMFVGYHASTHNVSGVRAHTFSSARLTRVALNGQPVTEGAWNAAIAGQFGVPVIFVSGDDAAVAEVRSAIGNIQYAETKRTLGFHSAETKTPEAAQKLIRERAAAAVRAISSAKPYRIAMPVTIDISFKSITPAEAACYLARVFTRTDSHSIRFTAKDMAETSSIFEFLMAYRLDLEP